MSARVTKSKINIRELLSNFKNVLFKPSRVDKNQVLRVGDEANLKPAPGVYIDDDGNLGAGTDSPNFKLHISDGNPYDTSFVSANSIKAAITTENGSGVFGSYVASDIDGHTGGFRGARARGSLSAPLVPVEGDKVIKLSGGIYDGTTTHNVGHLLMQVDGPVSSNITPIKISFLTSESNSAGKKERMTIKSDGKVGIGTTTPEAIFHMEDEGGYQFLYDRYGDNSGGANHTQRKSRGTKLAPLPVVSGDGAANFNGHVYTGADFVSIGALNLQAQTVNGGLASGKFNLKLADIVGNSQTRMVVDEEGSVGIGTMTPSAKLTVEDTSAGKKEILRLQNNGGSWITMHNSAIAAAWYMTHQDGNGNFNITNDNTPVGGGALLLTPDGDLTVRGQLKTAGIMEDSSGKIGIGTVTPTQLLDINGSTNIVNQLQIGKTGANGSATDLDIDLGYNANIGAEQNLRFYIDTNNDQTGLKFEWLTNATGITGATSLMNLTDSGDLTVAGTLNATSKSFLIDHPTQPDMNLRYGSLEGPENGVYVRGRLEGDNKIALPEYWTELVHDDSITVSLTANGSAQNIWVENISDNLITLASDGQIDCFYTVFAERKDIDSLIVEEYKAGVA